MIQTEDQKINPFRLEKTCTACPAQWEGFTDTGREVYIRYRGDRFSVHVACEQFPDIWSEEAWKHDEPCILDIGNALGEPGNGWMTTYQMQKLLIKHNLTKKLSFGDKVVIELDNITEYILGYWYGYRYKIRRYINKILG